MFFRTPPPSAMHTERRKSEGLRHQAFRENTKDSTHLDHNLCHTRRSGGCTNYQSLGALPIKGSQDSDPGCLLTRAFRFPRSVRLGKRGRKGRKPSLPLRSLAPRPGSILRAQCNSQAIDVWSEPHLASILGVRAILCRSLFGLGFLEGLLSCLLLERQ